MVSAPFPSAPWPDMRFILKEAARNLAFGIDLARLLSNVALPLSHVVGHAFKAQFEHLAFSNQPAWFDAWKNGMTGYPLIDAGMRQLNQTGYMHNRLRMVTASFLVKDLQIDWRWGERYFAEKLIDFDLAANNGDWQWRLAMGSLHRLRCTTLVPYFQSGHAIGKDYPAQIVDRALARGKTLQLYKR